ncbi:FERM and PDZ domain-containing protein 4-like [Watersipora subatra]|uniref:FERM and PDZ domain-containing protein 4-like n=1 Tax=Watersipora subatra TaxID=2589382 RepID=UPI00355B2F45
MSIRIKEKVRKIRRSLSWHNSHENEESLDGLRGSITHSSNGSFDQAGLPPGWESAIDKDGRLYYMNHNDNISTYNDPRNQLEYEYAETRIISLSRDPQLGFGFVAGSERPVVVRCVTEGGPSDQLLLPGDQIHKIDSEDVRDAPRSKVIELVRSAAENLVLTVSQPPTISTHGKKSILLNAAKKQQKLKRDSSATRVRFSEESLDTKKKRTALPVIASQDATNSNKVLKVFLETQQTRSFKYDGFTLVKDVLNALQEKLDIRSIEHFGLVIHNTRSPLSTKMSILSPQQKIQQVAERLTDEGVKCAFRIVFVPRDAYDLLRKDSIAFQYFYTQCCQDVIHERFSSDLKCDVALRLASLHMQEYAMDRHIPFHKISIKLIEREFSLAIFLNPSILRVVKPKELRKMLAHFMKLNQGLIAPGQNQVTPLQAKLHYMKIVSELRSFGGKCFLATLVDRRVEVMLIVGPKCGISQVTDIKSYALHMLADFDLIQLITVQPEKSGATRLIHIILTDKNLPTLALSMMNSDAKDFLIFVQGYHQLFCGSSDIIKYNSNNRESTSSFEVSGESALLPDCNMNGAIEPDYATIEEIASANDSGSFTNHVNPETNHIKEASVNLANRSRSKSAKGNVFIANVLSSNDEMDSAPSSNDINDSSSVTNQNAVNYSPATSLSEHCYDTPSVDIDEPPPTSSIDDLISDSSPENSPSSLRGTILKSTVAGLTDECLTEFSKLDQDGVLLDPGLFKDKGVYLNPQASPLELSVLPPPPDEINSQISPPAAIPPPPALFTDNSTEVDEHTEQLLLPNNNELNKPDATDKESGIDSDDSGTETLCTTANSTPNMTPHSIPPATVSEPPTQMPISSLRSRMQEQRAKAKLIAENTATQQMPIFYTPVKPEPVRISHRKEESSPAETLSARTSNKTIDIDSRMASALLQLNEKQLDNESADSSDEEMKLTSSLSPVSVSRNEVSPQPLISPPPMMISEDHVDVSTEEEDNASSPSTGEGETCPDKAEETEPTYMNSSIEVPEVHRLSTSEHEVTAAAIDEALNELSSESEDESKDKLNRFKADSSGSQSVEAPNTNNVAQPVTDSKSVSATIVITGSTPRMKTPVVTNPQPPPRRRKVMKSGSSLPSATTGEDRPSSRASVTSSVTSVERPSPNIKVDVDESTKDTFPSYSRSISNISGVSDTGSDRLSVGGISFTSSTYPSPRFTENHSNNSSTYPSPRLSENYSNNPISNDLTMLQTRAKRRSKQERLSRTASVIGVPTNITCTAGDVLANCIPIVRGEASPRPQPTSPTSANVTLTSRESLLDEIVKNAQGLGINPLGLTLRSGTSDRASISSASSLTALNKLARPVAPPPQPPTNSTSKTLAKKSSRSESNLLAAFADKSGSVSKVNEGMLAVEYTVLDNNGLANSDKVISKQQSVSLSQETTSAVTKVSQHDNTLPQDSRLEKEGSFIKFTGYSGEVSVSPTLNRKGRFRKKGSTTALDHVVGENHSRRGIMSKILSTIKPRKRSMSLNQLNVEAAQTSKSSSLKLPNKNSRPSILPGGNKDSKHSGPFRSLGRTKFHSKPKLSVSLSDLVSATRSAETDALTPILSSRSQSIDMLLDSNVNSPTAIDGEAEEVEDLPTSDSKITPAGILNYSYQPSNAFEKAKEHTRNLIDHFTDYCETQWAACHAPDPHNFTKIKETLISEGRQFVSNSKHLVAGVAQATGCTDTILVSKMAASVRTLAKIIQRGVETLKVATSEENMLSIKECIVTVSEAYADVLETSHKAAGKEIKDENMQVIMQKASHLASLLSLFLKTLRSLHEPEK